jgi:succinyl-diaminopimelate desuccinylase
MSANTFKQVVAAIEQLKPQAIELMKKLISINSVGPQNNGPGESEKADFLKNYLHHGGVTEFKDYPSADTRVAGGQRPNFSLVVPGRTKQRTLWIITHTDIVPPGDLSKWTGDPFQAVIKDGKIYGRGSEDNHQGIVSAITAAQAFMNTGIKPYPDLNLMFVADEETGSKFGLIHLLTQYPDLFKKEDLIIIPDAGEADSRLIEVAEKSMMWIKLKTTGKQVHASTPDQGINAFRAGGHLLVQLEQLARLFPHRDKVFNPSRSTFEPTKKDANVPNINTIPGEDVFYLDCRVLPAYQIQEVYAAIRKIADRIEQKFRVKIEISYEQAEQAAPATPVEAEIVGLLRSGIRKIYKRRARPQGIGGGTVAAILRRQGLPVAVWSTMDEVGHQPDEYCIIENMIDDAKVFAWCALASENL